MTKPKVLSVMNQLHLPKTLEANDEVRAGTCVLHAIKNNILYLLYDKKVIDKEQFSSLANDNEFFLRIYYAILDLYPVKPAERRIDFPIDMLANEADTIIRMFQDGTMNDVLGRFDIANVFGLAKENTSNISLFLDLKNQRVHRPENGILLGESHLVHFASLINLARSNKELPHVFVVGMSINERMHHSVALVLRKDDEGHFLWEVMDSDVNTLQYYQEIISIFESVLYKPEADLSAFIWEYYQYIFQENFFIYARYSDPMTGELLEGPARGTLSPAEVIESICTEQTIKRIMEHFQFMKSVGWLTSIEVPEIQSVTKLHKLATIIAENATPELIAASEFNPVYEEITTALNIIKQRELKDALRPPGEPSTKRHGAIPD